MAKTKNIPDKKQKRQRDWRKGSNAKKWADAQDWDELKAEFCELADDGTYEYPTIKAFVEEKYEDSERLKQLWLRRSIGHAPQRSVPWRGNWLVERELEKQEHGQQAKLLKRKVDKEINLLESAGIVADSYLPWNTRVDSLLGELDEYMGGRVILEMPTGLKDLSSYPGKTKAEKKKARDAAVYAWKQDQERRFSFVLHAYSRILKLKERVDDKYLKAIGWDRPQLVTWIAEQMEIGRFGQGPDELPDAGVQAALGSAVRAIIQKSQMYDMELPDDLTEMEVDEDTGVFRAKNGKNGSNGSRKNGKKKKVS